MKNLYNEIVFNSSVESIDFLSKSPDDLIRCAVARRIAIAENMASPKTFRRICRDKNFNVVICFIEHALFEKYVLRLTRHKNPIISSRAKNKIEELRNIRIRRN